MAVPVLIGKVGTASKIMWLSGLGCSSARTVYGGSRIGLRFWLTCLLSAAAILAVRRRQLGDLIAAQLPDVCWQPPQATCLAWLDCRRIGDGEEPRNVFLDRGRVALEPGPRFGTPGSGFVRLNFGTSEAVLAEAIRRTASALS
jgi:cysteine-S-conjugate beta-lyase